MVSGFACIDSCTVGEFQGELDGRIFFDLSHRHNSAFSLFGEIDDYRIVHQQLPQQYTPKYNIRVLSEI